MTPDVDTFAEIVAAADRQLPDLADSDIDAWVSSALGLWRAPDDPDPGVGDVAFLGHLDAQSDTVAATIAARVRSLLEGRPAGSARAAFSLSTPDLSGTSLAIELEYPDGDVRTLFADIGPDGLSDLRIGPAVGDLAAGQEEGVLELDQRSPVDAARAIAAAWRAAVDAASEPTASQESNDALARALLRSLGEDGLPRVQLDPIETPEADPEADRAALDTLRAALGDIGVADDGLADAAAALIRWSEPPVAGRADLRALAGLEWADWLGAVIGLVRAGPGTLVSPDGLVDLVNRCPEVTSSIPARDRGWYEAAFAVVIEAWTDLGVVDQDCRLSPEAVQVLPAALVSAWS